MQSTFRFLFASLFMVLSILFSVANNLIMRYLIGFSIEPGFILLVKQAFALSIIVLVLAIRRIPIFSNYWKLHSFKALAVPFAEILCGYAIQTAIPMYIYSFIPLLFAVIIMINARLVLNQPWTKTSWLFLLSVLPIFAHSFDTPYAHAIWLLLLAVITYSALDLINAYVLSKTPNGKIQHIIEHRGSEQIEVIVFWDNLISFIVYILFNIATVKLSDVTHSLQLKFIWIYFIMGIIAASILPLILLAYKIQNLSSMQFIRVLEPVLASLLNDNESIPDHIMIGLTLFAGTSIYVFIRNLGLIKSESEV